MGAAAAGPVLIALPGRRLTALFTAGVTAAVVMAPFYFAGGSVATQSGGGSSTGTMFNPWQLWWFFGSHSHVVRDLSGT